ncbi:hypothetical protein HXQ97_002577 [Salmonella enterica]|nr:hypothetical protein [Salmonella enterica]EIF9386466.1 hypothetical protein [Salmonella enterica]EIW9668665.1 hypothetical protein [Salmonella enterica]
MSENNYGALMLKSALDISVDVTKITSPGIYPIIQGNINVPDASAGLLTVSLTPSKPQITFQKENSSVVYSFVNGNWEKPTATDVDALAKSQNGADIPDPALFRQRIGVYDATISQKGIVMLSDNTGVPDSTTAATTTAVNYVLNQAAAAYSLAESKYTAGGATTGKAGLVQLVNSMGWSGSLVMPQAAVTTAIQSYPSLGKGQTLQDLRGSRSIDATYTNSTGFPIAVYVRISGGYSAVLYTHVNGIEFGGGGSTASNSSIATTFFIVPNGATYRVMASGASIALQAWSELR